METNTESNDHKAKQKEIEEGKGMAVVAYIIALIPYFAGDKKNKFVRYHAIQGMNLMLIAIGYSIVAGILAGIVYSIMYGNCTNIYSILQGGCNPGSFGLIAFIIWLPAMAIGVIDIIGIVNAVNGKEKEVPILGKVKIIKK